MAGKQQPKKVTKEMDLDAKLKVVDEELSNFYQFCKDQGFTPAEMEVICSPLLSPLRAAKVKRTAKGFVAAILAVALLYGVAQTSTARMHATAVGRLLMIKVRLKRNKIRIKIKNIFLNSMFGSQFLLFTFQLF